MGAHPYWYTVKYRPDFDAALEDLRQQEFQAGRYNPVMPFIDFPITPSSPAPGRRAPYHCRRVRRRRSRRHPIHPGHRRASADEPDFGVACPLAPEVLQSLYGTTRPTLAAVEGNMDFLADIERGQAVYVVCYTDGAPSELLFAGYSYD